MTNTEADRTGVTSDASAARYDGAWAKLDERGALPLAEHGNDVAAVFEQLLEIGWQERLEGALGRPLKRAERERLIALAYLHDLGKCNRGFWRRQFNGAPLVGHTAIVLALSELDNEWSRLSLLKVLHEYAGTALFLATLSHHGRPVIDPPNAPRLAEHWRAREDYAPLDELVALLEGAASRYPRAFADSSPPTEMAPRAVALFAGLLTLADWIGSDTEHFPLDDACGTERCARSRSCAAHRLAELGLTRGAALRRAPRTRSFAACFGNEPYPSQREAGDAGFADVVVLEAETGSGKTEAALWRFVSLFDRGEVDGLYFALPTRTSAVQLHTRVQRFLDRAFDDEAPQAVLAVPGYLRVGDDEGIALGHFETLWPEAMAERVEDARWSAESPKRYLAARIAVGTVDQVLMSGLRVRHAHLRASCLSRSLLVVDEVHASDAYMSEVLARVLKNHTAIGGRAMLLSATLGAAARTRLLGRPETEIPSLAEAVAVDYPALHDRRSTRAVVAGARHRSVRLRLEPWIDKPQALAEIALEAARRGARVLIVRNTVADAIDALEALETLAAADARDRKRLFAVEGVTTLHHGRFAPTDRRLLDTVIEARFGKARSEADSSGVVAVGTQTLEMSLDLDADLLLTDLAPMDVLLQRLGRLHRHDRARRPEGFEMPQAVVLTPSERDLSPLLGRVPRRHGLGPSGRDGRGVYPVLAVIEATWRTLESRELVEVPRDNRTLVELATHPEALETIERELGWEEAGARQAGTRLHDVMLARRLALDPSLSFADPRCVFPIDNEETVRTRLGASSWQATLEPPARGPFKRKISQINVPAWMLGTAPTTTNITAQEELEGLSFTLGERDFRYDRKGLRRL